MTTSGTKILYSRTGQRILFLQTAAATGDPSLTKTTRESTPEARTNLLAQFIAAKTRTGGEAACSLGSHP